MEFTTPELKPTITASPIHKERQQPIYWFRKENGVFCTGEEEAWNLLKGRVQALQHGGMQRLKVTYLGRSSGQFYFSGLKEMNKVFAEQGLEKAQEFIRELERKECETANPDAYPRNHDMSDLMGSPTNIEKLKAGI